MFSINNKVRSVNNSDMDTDPLNSGSDSETVKDQVKLVKVDLSDFNKNIVQCWECESTFQMESPLWGINQMNTKKIQCKVCMKFFLIKAALKTEPKYDNGTLNIESAVTIYTAGLETSVKNIRQCLSCKIKRELITIPIERFTSEEWFICKCGKNQCALIEFISPSEQLRSPARRSRKKNKRGNKVIKNIKHTTGFPVTGASVGQQCPRAPAQVHGLTSEISSGAPDSITIQQALATRVVRQKDNEREYLPPTNKVGGYTRGQTTQASSQTIGKVQTTLDAWKIPRFVRPPLVLDKSKSQQQISDNNQTVQVNKSAYQQVTRGAKRQRTGASNYATPTQKNTHIPNIIIRDENAIKNQDTLKKVRESVANNSSTLNVMRGQIKINPDNATARVNLLNTLEACGITRVIAPKPKADRQPATKIVLKNETYGESIDTIINEIADCIGVQPTAVKPLGRAGKIHLLIFDGKHKLRELMESFKTSERKFFCAPSIKVEPFRENPKHIVQCKKCYAFDHSKQSCYGKQEDPQIVITTPEGTTTKVCRNCKAEDHGANNAKCPVFKSMIARQMEQAEAKQIKKEERIKRSVVRLGVKYADVTDTRQFPTLSQNELTQPPTEQMPTAIGGLTLEGLFHMQTQMQQTLMTLMDTINRIHSHLNG